MKKFSKILVFTFVLIFAAAGCIPATAENAKTERLTDGIVAYNLKSTSSASIQDWIDGYLTENADNGTEWYVIALSNYGKYDFTSYKKALGDYLSSNEVGSASSRLKFALALIAAGEKNSPFITEFLENSVGEQGIMSLVFGLHILNNGYTCEKYSVKALTEELLSLQSDDGGWSLTGKNGDVDVTAMTVQALAPQYKGSAEVRTATDKALVFLSSRQNSDGTFSSYGVSNPESISQVIIALSSLGINAENDTRFIKNSKNLFDALELFHSTDGGYSHKQGEDTDSTATVQVFCAAVAFKKMRSGGSPFYVFSQENNIIIEPPEEEKTEVEEITQETNPEKTSVTNQSEKAETSYSQISEAEKEISKTNVSYKIGLIAFIIIAAVCICAIMFAAKKRKSTGYLIVIAVAVFLIIFVAVTNIKPFETVDNSSAPNDIVGTVTISIRCDTIKDKNSDMIPENGVILEETEFQISAEDTVYDVLSQVCQENGIHFEVTGSKDTLYVEGIFNIYEKDYGDLSGWMYFVNGTSPSVGCGNYVLSDKDEIVWCYTCELGEDLNN